MKKEEEEENEENIQDIDITKIKIQRKKNFFENDEKIKEIRELVDGKIAIKVEQLGIAIIDPDSLEIIMTIEIPAFEFI